MSDLEPLIYDRTVEINGTLIALREWLMDYLRGGLDTESDDLFDIIGNFRTAVTDQLDGVEDRVVTEVQNVSVKVDAVSLKLDNVSNFLQSDLFPVIQDIQTIVTANAEQLTYISKNVEELPEKTAALVNAHIDAEMGSLSNSVDLLRLMLESRIQEQTNVIVTAMADNNTLLVASINSLSTGVTTQINTMSVSISTAVTDGFTSQNQVLAGIRTTLEEQLQAISEKQSIFQDALTLFITEFWANMRDWWAGAQRVTNEDYDTAVAGAKELSTRIIGQTVSESVPQEEDTSEIESWLEGQQV